MSSLAEFIRNYDVYIIFVLLLINIINIFILIFNNAGIYKLSKKYRKFMRGGKDKNIEELLLSLSDNVNEAISKTEEVKSYYNAIDHRIDNCIQKCSIIRYKAFSDIGSAALSFSIALLNAHDDGFILTGIYGSEECTTYAKPIDKGVPKYDLSDEEKQVLNEAIRQK